MAITLPDARQLSDEVLEALRLRALRGIELGFAEVDVAAMLGVAQETVSRWWTAYATGGLDAIPHARTGRPVGSGTCRRNGSDRLIVLSPRSIVSHAVGNARPVAGSRAGWRTDKHANLGNVCLATRDVDDQAARLR